MIKDCAHVGPKSADIPWNKLQNVHLKIKK